LTGTEVRPVMRKGIRSPPFGLIPVIGIADDVILVAPVLRSVTRIAGPAALPKHWPGRVPHSRPSTVRNVPIALVPSAISQGPPEQVDARA